MVSTTHNEVERERLRAIGAAALLAQLVTVYLLVVRAIAPATETNWAHADPILAIAPRAVSLWLVPILAVVAAIAWLRISAPRAADLRRGLRHAAIGVAVAGAMVGLLRLLSGETLPSFVPAEENAAPGYLLSMTAGFAEEVLFRFAMLPVLYLLLARRLARPAAIAFAAVATGLAFALLHDAGPGSFDAGYFVTRLLIPGTAMSVLFLAVSPSLLVAAHCSAHILMPALFVGG